MAKEIERKFKVNGDFIGESHHAYQIAQGYLSTDPARTVRVRIRDDEGFLTIKGARDATAMSCAEHEFPIPVDKAREILRLALPTVIDKTRYLVTFGGHLWEVDQFHGANEGLIIAEIELESEDEAFEKPLWLGEEVTGDPRYYNASLTSYPYSQWAEQQN